MNPLVEATPPRAPKGAQTRLALPDTVPAELAGLPQRVAWRWEERDGKPTKPPLNPHAGQHASATDPATWGTLQDALRFCRANPWAAGVGFVFTKDDLEPAAELAGLGERSESTAEASEQPATEEQAG
jgi:primase-polymerase (primpol)-like protein